MLYNDIMHIIKACFSNAFERFLDLKFAKNRNIIIVITNKYKSLYSLSLS